MDCIFCRIVKGELPAEKVYEDEAFVAFRDIRPKAPVHVLVVPKAHVDRLSDYPDTEAGAQALGELFRTVNRVARDVLKLEGYRVQVNVGPEGGQEVFHVHVHVLGGWRR